MPTDIPTDIPPTPGRPTTITGDIPDQPRPPSDLLNAKAQPAMPGRADMSGTPPDDAMDQQRHEDINPSRAREQPPDD